LSCPAHSFHEHRVSGSDLEFRRHGRLADQAGGRRDVGFGNHVDGMARTLLEANGAAGAEIVIDAIEPTAAELHDRLPRTGGGAVVAFEAVPAGQAAARLLTGLRSRQAPGDPLQSPSLVRRYF